MSAAISVTREDIKKFFEDSRKRPFYIPEYQRPYEWGTDETATLFEDIREFAEDNNSQKTEYFLGAIVFYENNNYREIIDGHQRIVTLMLLFRVIYGNLEAFKQTDRRIDRIKNAIEQLIWNHDLMSETFDRTQILIKSEVIDEQTEKTFTKILESGDADPNAQDRYSQNYLKLQSLYKDYCGRSSESAIKFISCLLNQIIVLPIQADSQDMALTIFSTLNARGKPLSDADLFKAKMYRLISVNNRREFINQWQELEERASDVGKKIDTDLFQSYMFYLRAAKGIRNSTIGSVKDYFLRDHIDLLKSTAILDDLDRILNIWVVINQYVKNGGIKLTLPGESWTRNAKILKLLDILSSHPNNSWQHTVVIYYMVYGTRKDFDKRFLHFLRKLLAKLVPQNVVKTGANYIKEPLLALNINIFKTPYPMFNGFKTIDEGVLDRSLTENKNMKTLKMLLKLFAYDNKTQIAPLSAEWQVEHIFPQKWDSNYDLGGLTPDEVNALVQSVGNLTPLEAKKNIKASNDFFSKKKLLYRNSSIEMTKELGKRSDWRPNDIGNRNRELSGQLKRIVSEWNDEYDEAKRNYDQQHRAETPT